MALTDTLSATGIQAFGSSMPTLAKSWTAGTPTLGTDDLSLELAGGTWTSPLAGFVRTAKEVADRAGVLLRGSRGGALAATASVVSLFPQQYLRLARLYAAVIEGGVADA